MENLSYLVQDSKEKRPCGAKFSNFFLNNRKIEATESIQEIESFGKDKQPPQRSLSYD